VSDDNWRRDPIPDDLVREMKSFSAEINSLIVEVVKLGGQKELKSNFDLLQFPKHSPQQIRDCLLEMRNRLRKEAKERGWEVE
jgi:hypothetical protein